MWFLIDTEDSEITEFPTEEEAEAALRSLVRKLYNSTLVDPPANPLLSGKVFVAKAVWAAQDDGSVERVQ